MGTRAQITNASQPPPQQSLFPQTFSHNDYTVGWISALSLEMAAAMAMFDDTHLDLPLPPADRNTYRYGTMSGHNVVITCLPAGVYGTSSATAVVTQMRSTFPQLQFCLLVGIGGGVPSDVHDIRLGDVVVSKPTPGSSGVIPYDYGKTVSKGRFLQTGTANKPAPVLLNAIAQLDAHHRMRGGAMSGEERQRAAARHPDMISFFYSPGFEEDLLFEADYEHVDLSRLCGACCDRERLVARSPRTIYEEPRIFYGTIASANQVMKHGATRDRLAKEHGILCFEMEAAGVVEHVPYLVVRGICDYADSHKQKHWQDYAAANAAVYAKEILAEVPKHVDGGTVPIAATVINVSNICSSTAKTLYNIRANYKDAPMYIVSICSETSVISASLSQVQSLLLRHTDLPQLLTARPDLATALDAALTGCMVLYSCLDDQIRTITARSSQLGSFSWRSRAKISWNKDKLRELLDGLHGLQSSLNLLIQLLQVDTITEIKRLVNQGRPVLVDTVKKTESLRHMYPQIDVPESIYSRDPDQDGTETISSLSDQHFDFDSVLVNTKTYRRALAAATAGKARPEEPPTAEIIVGDLIDLSDTATLTRGLEARSIRGAGRDLQGLVMEEHLPGPTHILDLALGPDGDDYGNTSMVVSSYNRETWLPSPQENNAHDPKDREPHQIESTGEGRPAVFMRALYDYDSHDQDMLRYKKGDIIQVLDRRNVSGWWDGVMEDGNRGFFFSESCSMIIDPTELPAPREAKATLYVCARYNYDAEEENELTIRKGDFIRVINRYENGWWDGVLDDGTRGLFPSNFTEITDTTDFNEETSHTMEQAAGENEDGTDEDEDSVYTSDSTEEKKPREVEDVKSRHQYTTTVALVTDLPAAVFMAPSSVSYECVPTEDSPTTTSEIDTGGSYDSSEYGGIDLGMGGQGSHAKREQTPTCLSCGEDIRSAYKASLGKAYHLEHWRCEACTQLLETGNTVEATGSCLSCSFYHCTRDNLNCSACSLPILDPRYQTFEDSSERHHMECYWIYSKFNIIIINYNFDEIPDLSRMLRKLDYESWEPLYSRLKKREEGLFRMQRVLKSYMRRGEKEVSTLLQYVKAGDIISIVKLVGRYVNLLESLVKGLFAARARDSAEGLRALCESFAKLLSKSLSLRLRRDPSLQSLSQDVSTRHRSLIGVALKRALRTNERASGFLNEISARPRTGSPLNHLRALAQLQLKSADHCSTCGEVVNITCYFQRLEDDTSFVQQAWHPGCLACERCHILGAFTVASGSESLGNGARRCFYCSEPLREGVAYFGPEWHCLHILRVRIARTILAPEYVPGLKVDEGIEDS